MITRRGGLIVELSCMIAVAGLVGCSAAVAEPKNTPIGPNPSLAESDDERILREACGTATIINTLVRLPDIQVTGGEPGTEPITAEAWLESILEAKDRADRLLRTDMGIYADEIEAFASAVLEVSEIPPVAPLAVDSQPDLTEAAAGLAAECEAVGRPIGVVLPSTFGG